MVIVDYAYPCMMAEKALKDAHNYMLDNKYDEALATTMAAIVESKLMYNAIMHQREDAIDREKMRV